jgi:hypothetical protein
MVALFFKWLFIPVVFLSNFKGEKLNAGNEKTAHPFYISVTEINHNSKDKTLEVSCKIFVDDMESTLKQNYKVAVNLTDAKQQAANDKMINDYISKHLIFATDGKRVKLNYLGFEKESESVFCYFEVENTPAFKKLDVSNSLLQDFTEDQINIMHVTVNGNRKSYKLDYPNKQASFSF